MISFLNIYFYIKKNYCVYLDFFYVENFINVEQIFVVIGKFMKKPVMFFLFKNCIRSLVLYINCKLIHVLMIENSHSINETVKILDE